MMENRADSEGSACASVARGEVGVVRSYRLISAVPDLISVEIIAPSSMLWDGYGLVPVSLYCSMASCRLGKRLD